MKSMIISLVVFIFLTVNAQQPATSRFINLNGTAEHITDADEITFNVQVRTTAKTLEEAKRNNDSQVAQLRKIIDKYVNTKEDFEISPISLGKEYEWNNNKRIDKGYFASTNVTIKLKDFTKYYDMTDELASSDNFTVNSFYSLSNYEHFNKITNEKALLAAKEKAAYMTQALGVKLGRVLEIEEAGDYQPMLMRNKVEMDAGAGSETIAGKITIRKSVRVKFELED